VEAPKDDSPGTGEAEVEAELKRADEEDTGRGLEFAWLNGEVGYQVAGLDALSSNELVDGTLIEQNHAGLVYGAGVGIRLFVLTLGARFRYAPLQDGRLWSLNAESSLRIPLGRLEFYVLAAAGYVTLGGFGANAATGVDLSQVSLSGFNARAGAGLDFYLSNTFSVGANVSSDLLFLQRRASDVAEMVSPAEAVYASDGSGIGATFTSTAVLGLHF